MVKNIWVFFYIRKILLFFSTKMDRDIIIIRQPAFFFSSEHHWVHIQLCDVHAKFVNTFFVLFVNTFISCEKQTLVINIKYRHIQYTHTLSQLLKSTQCQMWLHINIHVRCEYTSLLAIKWPLVIKQPPPFWKIFFFF